MSCAHQHRSAALSKTHLDAQVRMQQHLELKRARALIAHRDNRAQTFFAQRYAVHQPEVKRPCLAELVRQRRAVQAEVELDAAARALRFLATEELPPDIARKAVLRK